VLLSHHFDPTAGGHSVAWPVDAVLAASFLMYFVGIVASIFLFRGARWARWVLGFIAIYFALGCIAGIAIHKLLAVWSIAPCVFALVSLVLLFLPRREPVA